MVVERLVYCQQHRLGRGVGDGGVGGDMEGRNAGIAGGVGVVHDEPAVRRVARIERQAQQTLLASGGHSAPKIEKGRPEGAILDDPDAPALFDDEQPGVAGRDSESDWELEAGGDRLEGKRELAIRRRARIGAGHQGGNASEK